MPKPLRVWLVQAMARLAAGACALTLDVLAPIVRSGRAEVRFLAESALAAGVIVCAGFALVGRQQRRACGRWCGVLLLAGIVLKGGLTCVDWFRAMTDNSDEAGLTFDDVALAAAVVAAMGLALVLGWSYGFSRRCRAWFRMPAKSAST